MQIHNNGKSAINSDGISAWVNTNQVTRFFYFFSKLEHALKRNEFLIKNQADAKADWDTFADKLGNEFFQKIKAEHDIQILFKVPPRKQINNAGTLDWKDEASPQNVKDLFVALRRVRNNLFHGGKYPYAPVEEPSRNDKLLRACLFVMESVINENTNIRATFNEPAE
jgi:hypothetical protein